MFIRAAIFLAISVGSRPPRSQSSEDMDPAAHRRRAAGSAGRLDQRHHHALRASRAACRQSVPDGKGSGGAREAIGAKQGRSSSRRGRRRQLQSGLVRFGHQGRRHAPDFAGRGSAGRESSREAGGRGQARLRPGAHQRFLRVHEHLGSLHHPRRPRADVPRRIQQRVSDRAEPGIRRDHVGNDSRRPRHSARRARACAR